MLLLIYPKCSTCKRACSWLSGQGREVEIRDIKENNPSEEELRRWHAMSGLPLKRFFNTSGKTYRELDLKNRLPEMSEAEQFALLASDGMLVKRPLLVGETGVCPGYNEDIWANLK